MSGRWKNRHDYWNSDAGKLTNYRHRKRNRVQIAIEDIEPQSKNIRDGQKDAFQRNVIEQLNDMKRAAFKGPIALGLDLATTRATAPQAHTIAKNCWICSHSDGRA
jgi:hypothetical protein